ncbi:MAG TPA: hypothetical protein VG758_21445, partial [Hyphomicrobiaceae bacterium]|nr:hypothetical protein [Hyphomicrobiaceae bacterium]
MLSLAARRNALVPVTRCKPPAAPGQLGLALDDARLRGLSETERRSVSQALAHLLLEASGVARQEVGH